VRLLNSFYSFNISEYCANAVEGENLKRLKSMAGRLAGKKRYSTKEILRNLRDESDRF
jgi:hypothetical protein